MTIADWQRLGPERAADELLRRVGALGRGITPAIAAMADRDELVRRFAAAPRGGVLAGVPYFAKDLFDAAGEATRAGSAFLGEVRPIPPRDGAMVRAFREAGAVLAGKAQLQEFAFGLTGDNAHFGNCDNPRFRGRTTGGSSSGSAALVAAGVVPLATGSDTGGSVRAPAANCGIFGFRMTPGHPWIADAFPLAPIFDTAGWFTASAEDMALSLEGLGIAARGAGAGPGAKMRGCFLESPGCDPEVAAAVRGAAGGLAEPAGPAEAAELGAAFAGLGEAYSVLGSRAAYLVHREWLDRQRDRYSPAVWSRIDRGRRWSAGQIERAERDVARIRRTWTEFFRTWDFLVLAATPFVAPAHGDYGEGRRDRQLALSAPASVGGCPVLTIPVAVPGGGSAGLQIVAKDSGSPVFPWALARSETRPV